MEQQAILLFARSHELIKELNQTNEVIDFLSNKIEQIQPVLELTRIQSPNLMLIEICDEKIKYQKPFDKIKVQLSVFLNAVLTVMAVFMFFWVDSRNIEL